MKKEIILSRCPLCGAYPNHRVEDMGQPPYQHYYDSFDYIYECPKCKVIHVSADTVYCKDRNEAEREAKEAWNKKCKEWEKTLSWRNAIDSIAYGLEPHWDLDALADYVTNTPVEQLDREVAALNIEQREQLVDMLLSSKYDIFNPWYKRLLISLDTFRTNDILSYYKKGFDEVKEEV